MFRGILLVFLFEIVCGVEVENRLVGVDTVHDVGKKINKNTIITRNLKLESREKKKGVTGSTLDGQQSSEGPPDWSYNAIPEEMNEYVADFKKNMSECLKEVQESDSRTVKRMSPRAESPVHGECLIACVLKRNGVISKDKVNKENLLALVNKFFAKDTKLMKKLEKHVDSCIAMSARHKDECDLAARLNACTNDIMAYNKHKITVNY